MNTKTNIGILQQESALSVIMGNKRLVLLIPPFGLLWEHVQSISWVIDALSLILEAESKDRDYMHHLA